MNRPGPHRSPRGRRLGVPPCCPIRFDRGGAAVTENPGSAAVKTCRFPRVVRRKARLIRCRRPINTSQETRHPPGRHLAKWHAERVVSGEAYPRSSSLNSSSQPEIFWTAPGDIRHRRCRAAHFAACAHAHSKGDWVPLSVRRCEANCHSLCHADSSLRGSLTGRRRSRACIHLNRRRC